ncbi:MAG: hypothetical protein KJO55_03680 [Gammaproteobacteria bacterium]|nr:hypothetical protein [Gammaproteobacteria bacterium]
MSVPGTASLRHASTVVFAAVLLGCGETPQPPTSSARANDAAPTLITLAPHLTELVYSAGAGRQLIAVVEYSDHPPAASELPVLAMHSASISNGSLSFHRISSWPGMGVIPMR